MKTTSQKHARSALAALTETLSRELDAARALSAAVERQRSAVRAADDRMLRGASEEVRRLSGQIAELERSREASLAMLGLPAEASLSEAVQSIRAVGADAAALAQLGDALRAELLAARRAMAVVRAAADRLAAHLSGIRSSVYGPVGARVYGRRGEVAAAGCGFSTLDIRH